jgi:hypothetical protein
VGQFGYRIYEGNVSTFKNDVTNTTAHIKQCAFIMTISTAQYTRCAVKSPKDCN